MKSLIGLPERILYVTDRLPAVRLVLSRDVLRLHQYGASARRVAHAYRAVVRTARRREKSYRLSIAALEERVRALEGERA